jgi:hypothetical protein
LDAYNSLLSRTFIDIPILEEKFIKMEGDSPVYVNQRDKFVRRVFNRGSFECGGRFYGGWWQRCPKKWRQSIFINDQPTNEVDFSGLHVVMLYAERGVPYWHVVGRDPYEIQVPDFLDDEMQARNVAKKLMLVLINAGSVKDAFSAFRNKAPQGSFEKRLDNVQLEIVRRLLVEQHEIIADSLGSDAGIRLMNRDSEISARIIDRFTEIGTPILSVHDSYIVTDGHEDFLIEAMSEAFQAVMGVPLGPPIKSVKEQSERTENLERALNTWMPYENLPWQKKDEESYKLRRFPKKSVRYKKEWEKFREWL